MCLLDLFETGISHHERHHGIVIVFDNPVRLKNGDRIITQVVCCSKKFLLNQNKVNKFAKSK